MKSGDHVSVALCVESETLLPEEISKRIGLAPTWSYIKGALNRVNKPMPTNLWGLERRLEADAGGAIAHEMLPACIQSLLDTIDPFKSVIAALPPLAKSVICIGIVARNVPGFELSSSQIALMASMGVSLDYSLTLYG